MNQKGLEYISNLNFFENLGYDIYIPYTQAYHESAGFARVIGNYNFWGITTPRGWKGKTFEILTHEYIKEVRIQQLRKFIDFETITEAFQWYNKLIMRLYSYSYLNRDNYVNFFNGLVNGKYKYATDPKYVQKLTELYELFKKNNVLKKVGEV